MLASRSAGADAPRRANAGAIGRYDIFTAAKGGDRRGVPALRVADIALRR